MELFIMPAAGMVPGCLDLISTQRQGLGALLPGSWAELAAAVDGMATISLMSEATGKELKLAG